MIRCPNKCGNQKITPAGPSFTTAVYYPPIYNEAGLNTNPDRNALISCWKCLNCGCRWINEDGKIKILEKGSKPNIVSKILKEEGIDEIIIKF